MAKNDLLLYGILAVGAYIWYKNYGGKSVIDGLIGDLKGGLGGGSQINTGQNVSGDDADQIQSKVQGMLEKMGVHGSGESISRTRQVDTTGQAVQRQSHSQKSTVFYTIPRFGNL